jgi:hypothetical protein
MHGMRFVARHALLRRRATEEVMRRNSGVGRNLHRCADTATVCRAEFGGAVERRMPLRGLAAGSFDRIGAPSLKIAWGR